MNIGGGEAADQLVRMLLSGTEVSVRLGGSALKNLLALTMALAKNNKTLSGKVNLGKMLRETRDLRQFSMTPEQYKRFARLAKKQKILFSAIRDRDDRGKLIDVIPKEISQFFFKSFATCDKLIFYRKRCDVFWEKLSQLERNIAIFFQIFRDLR